MYETELHRFLVPFTAHYMTHPPAGDTALETVHTPSFLHVSLDADVVYVSNH